MIGLFLSAVTAAAFPALAEQPAIFRAAGFALRAGVWKSGNCDGLESKSYMPGRIKIYRDLNGDRHPDAVVIEGGAICYGNTGMHFWLLSKQKNGRWKRTYEGTAMPQFLATKGVGGWPDVFMGGPGLCHRVVRWNGKAYVPNRFQGFDGKPCKLQ